MFPRKNFQKPSRITAISGTCLIALFLFSGNTFAQKGDPYAVKANVMVKFLSFVEWPQEMMNDDSMVILVIGKDPTDEDFGKSLDKPIKYKGKKLKVLRERKYRDDLDLKNCHLIFISRSEKRNISKILEKVKGLNILTVSESKGFVEEDGGIVNFIDGQKVGFEINQKAAIEIGLSIPSNLLRLAENVVRKDS